MPFLSADFFAPNTIIGYINASISALLSNNLSMASSKEYWLFYFIRENYLANISSLHGVELNLDCFGFSLIHRNTRHSIESFLDLVNLYSDSSYMTVLEYCAGNKKDVDNKFIPYLHKGSFTIQSKYKIANELFAMQIPDSILAISRRSNNYVHPNVLLNIISPDNINARVSLLKELLEINLYMMTKAYELLIKKFVNGVYPCLGCMNCLYQYNACEQCYRNEKAKMESLIRDGILTYVAPAALQFHP